MHAIVKFRAKAGTCAKIHHYLVEHPLGKKQCLKEGDT